MSDKVPTFMFHEMETIKPWPSKRIPALKWSNWPAMENKCHPQTWMQPEYKSLDIGTPLWPLQIKQTIRKVWGPTLKLANGQQSCHLRQPNGCLKNPTDGSRNLFQILCPIQVQFGGIRVYHNPWTRLVELLVHRDS